MAKKQMPTVPMHGGLQRFAHGIAAQADGLLGVPEYSVEEDALYEEENS
jgi:hypothetical protein